MNLAANVIAAVLLLALVFVAGWKVSGWRAGASKVAHYEQQLERMAEQVAERDRQMQMALSRLSDFDAETERRSRDTMDAVSGVAQSLGETRDAIVIADMGRAGLSPDADRLRLEAYRAATSSIGAAAGDPGQRAGEGSTPAAADPAGRDAARGAGADPEPRVR